MIQVYVYHEHGLPDTVGSNRIRHTGYIFIFKQDFSIVHLGNEIGSWKARQSKCCDSDSEDTNLWGGHVQIADDNASYPTAKHRQPACCEHVADASAPRCRALVR